MQTIAESLNISTATVSKALSGRGGVSDETARRVAEAARKLGYMPNAAARSLKTRCSRNVGLITKLRNKNGLAHDFISKIASAFQAEADDFGYDVTLLGNGPGKAGMSYLEHCRYRNFDGVVIISGDICTPQARELLESDVPTVLVDGFDSAHSTVMTDNERALRDMVDYAYAKGHRDLAFIYGDECMLTRVRMASFHRACQAHGLTVPEPYVRSALYNDFETTFQATKALMALTKPPTCIFFPDDLAYLGGLEALNQMGLSVPRDVSAVGFDGIYLSQAIRPKLCTLKQDADGIGSAAFRLLLEEVNARKTFLPRQITIPGTLLPGETVAAPR